jgi:hypothetical protein
MVLVTLRVRLWSITLRKQNVHSFLVRECDSFIGFNFSLRKVVPYFLNRLREYSLSNTLFPKIWRVAAMKPSDSDLDES